MNNSALIASPFISVETANQILAARTKHHLKQVDPVLYYRLTTGDYRSLHLPDLISQFLAIACQYNWVILPIGSAEFQWLLAQSWPHHDVGVLFTTRPEPVPADVWDGYCDAVRLALPVQIPLRA